MTTRTYRLLGREASGDLAEDYRAVDDEGRQLAVKLFHERTSEDDYARALVSRTQPVAVARPRGIRVLLDLGRVNRRLALVQELHEGYSLAQVLQRLRTKEVVLPHTMALAWFVELLQLAGELHERGVVHGGISPGTVFVGAGGHVELADVGVLAALADVPSLRRSPALRARSPYRAPELSREAPTAASDQYAIAALGYELLTLQEVPAQAESSAAARHTPIVPPSRLSRRLNARIDAVLLRSLDPSSGRRFASCADMTEALRALTLEAGGLATEGDLSRFQQTLKPNEVQFEPSGGGPVPFDGSFALEGIRGASLGEAAAAGGTVHPTVLMMPKPGAAGGGRPDETTAKLEQKPDVQAEAGAEADAEPPLAPGWHAPPGSIAARRPPAATPEARPAARRRLRVIEGYTPLPEPPPGYEPTATVLTPSVEVSPTLAEHPARGAPQFPPPKFEVPTRVDPPAPTSRSGRVPVTRSLVPVAIFGIGVVLLLGSVYLYVVAASRFDEPLEVGARGTRPVGPRSAPASVLVEAPQVERQPPAAEVPQWHIPPTGEAAYLTVDADRSAWVYVDGKRVRWPTPLRRYPVSPGERQIGLVDQQTNERRDFTIHLVPDEQRKIREQFGTEVTFE